MGANIHCVLFGRVGLLYSRPFASFASFASIRVIRGPLDVVPMSLPNLNQQSPQTMQRAEFFPYCGHAHPIVVKNDVDTVNGYPFSCSVSNRSILRPVTLSG
jgi:hypothetical protein